MKVCNKCNKSYLDGAKFCEVCGAPLDLVQENLEAKPKQKIMKTKKLGQKISAENNPDASNKEIAKPLKKVKPLVRKIAERDLQQEKALNENFVLKKPVTEPVVNEESKAIEPEPAVESEPVVEEPKAIEPEPAVESEPVVEEPKAIEPEPVVESEPVNEESKEIEPEPVVVPEPVVEEPNAIEPEPAVEPEPVNEESKEIEPEPVVESEPVVEEPNEVESEPVVVPEPVIDKPKAVEPEPEPVASLKKEQGTNLKNTMPLIVAAIGLIALIGVGVFFIFGEKSATYLKCDNSVVFPVEGGKYYLNIDTDGDFDLVKDLEWVTTRVSDNRVEIVCISNEGGSMRKGTLKLVSGDLSESVDIIQKGIATYINLSPEKLFFSSKGGCERITVDSDGSGLNVVGSGCLITNKSEGGFDVSVSTHSGVSRTGKVIVSSGNVSTVMTFYQKGICGKCHGSGKVVCSACSGTGKVQSWYNYGDPCTVCGQSGKLSCSNCGGMGEK